jgi:thiopurine S-methyltransferase
LEYKEDVKDGLVRFSVNFIQLGNERHHNNKLNMFLQTTDERLEIFICDMMETDPTKFGKFDLIWDRGSLVAINCEDRDKYASFMKTVMGPQTRYLFNSIMYDQSRYSGPPMSVTHEVINQLYGKGEIKLI